MRARVSVRLLLRAVAVEGVGILSEHQLVPYYDFSSEAHEDSQNLSSETGESRPLRQWPRNQDCGSSTNLKPFNLHIND